jgi:hypothetical protein
MTTGAGQSVRLCCPRPDWALTLPRVAALYTAMTVDFALQHRRAAEAGEKTAPLWTGLNPWFVFRQKIGYMPDC